MASRKSLVTGATGFIGSHLVEALVAEGNEVRCLVRNESSHRWIQGLNVEIVQGDCQDFRSLTSAVNGVEQVYHVAGITKATDHHAFYQVNAEGTENLVRACAERNPGLKRFVYLSSQAAVGPCKGDGLSTETDPCLPVSHYGWSKRRGEEAVLKFRDLLNVVILRACAVYGPRDQDFLPFFRSIGMGVQIGLWRMEHRLSLCYVNDLVSAFIVAGRKDLPSGEIFFVSDGNTYAWHDLGSAIEEALGVRAIRVKVPVSVFRWSAEIADWISRRSGRPRVFGKERYQEMVQPNWCCDSSKAMSELDLSAAFDLKRGIASTVEWYRAEGWLKS
ncbi:MAG: NAD-dependent epimerase/dehydratase family protein [Proteobacteria bacterium]|nr:NAD-dependent epimerase/dehydratase family protein [Pseudomonadota bacterium]